MKKNRTATRAVFFLCLSTPLVSWASDMDEAKPQFSVGLKAWHSSWLSYFPGAVSGVDSAGTPGSATTYDMAEGGQRTTFFPVLAVRYNNYFLSANYARYSSNFHLANSSVIGPDGRNVLTSRSDHFDRDEADLTAGYSITPNIALSLGYKHATEARHTSLGIAPGISTPLSHNTFKALLFGALANLPLQGGLGVYGQLGYGPTRLNITVSPDNAVSYRAHGTYLISEIGLTYVLPVQTPLLKSSSIGLGYRSQTTKTRSPIGGFSRDLRDVKDGIIFSLNMSI